MVHNFACPICATKDWCVGRTHTYSRESSREMAAKRHVNSPYLDLRRQVLLELWLSSELYPQLTSVCCRKCGFMCYSPRPDETDLDAKYRFLSNHEAIGTLQANSRRAATLRELRARALFNRVSQLSSSKVRSVLDVGGGDGHLLKQFISSGSRCYIVDYNPKAIDGVIRLGSKPDDLSPGEVFDAVICSHVLEHVVSPLNLLKKLRAAIAPKGVLYFEVPCEIWYELPIHMDPVTHINFFSTASLNTLLQSSGFQPLMLRRGIAPYGERYKRVIWGVAASGVFDCSKMEPSTTFALLFPSLTARVIRLVENCWLHGVLNVPLTFRRIWTVWP